VSDLFPGFITQRAVTSGAEIHFEIGGSGPPLLLLHGFPQTHAMWHKVAPALAHSFTVVCADLRGYGDSSKPPTDANHAPYSKRAMALDMVEVMRSLGFDRYAVGAHDRGARVAHRMCVDHPGVVARAALLDICPTRLMYAQTDFEFAKAYYHWFFLIQPFDMPERMIGADPAYYLQRKTGSWGSGNAFFDSRAFAEYERCYCKPETIHASCEDYRASASIDLAHDDIDVAAGRKVTCPLLILWGEKGVVHRCFDPIEDWRSVATDVRGRTMPTGHYIAEEAPEETLREFVGFFGQDGR
jgi:haloacetate dehalogenase